MGDGLNYAKLCDFYNDLEKRLNERWAAMEEFAKLKANMP